MAYKRNAKEASVAVNALLHFCDDDHQSLLEVLDDYFTSSADLDSSDVVMMMLKEVSTAAVIQ